MLHVLTAVTFSLLAPPLAPPATRPTAEESVATMIAAHGGLAKWASAPTVSFDVEMLPAGQTVPIASRVVVEQSRRRAYLDFSAPSARIAWDGEKAWSENWSLPFPPRFLALLHYYFANLPWLTQDPGVHLKDAGTARLPGDPTDYALVRMTFAEGVGDSPRDSYVLFIDPRSGRLRACEYIVTYKAVLPQGVDSTPPNLLLYEAYETVNGLTVPTRYEIFGKQGHVPYAKVRLRDWSFSSPFDASRMVMSPGAVLDRSAP